MDANTHDTSFAVSLYPSDYWDICDVVAVISNDKKEVSSTKGHKLAATSAFFERRLEIHKEKMKQIKESLHKKNFKQFGEIVEAEALELHAIYITSSLHLFIYCRERCA